MKKKELTEMIEQRDKRIADLELQLGCCRDASTGKDLLIDALERWIVELEAMATNSLRFVSFAFSKGMFGAEEFGKMVEDRVIYKDRISR